MPAFDIFKIGTGEALIEDDIGCERSPAQSAFQQVVTQYRVFGNPAVDAAMERGDIINALADKNADAEQILIHVGNRAAIYVYRCIAGKKTGEKCPADTLRRHFDPGLKNRIAGDDLARDRIKPCNIFRMCQRASQLSDRSGGQDGVGVGGNDEPYPGKCLAVSFMNGEGLIIIFDKQPVELLQLPSFSLPGHPAALAPVIVARAKQEMKRTGLFLAMPTVQRTEMPEELGGNFLVGWHMLSGRIGKVGKQGNLKMGVDIGQPVGLALLNQVGYLFSLSNQGRDDDDRPAIGRQAFGEI